MQAKILIVDDEPDLEVLVAQKFRRQIREGLVSLLFARDGAEALSLIKLDSSIDVVLSDLNMPRMDGLSLLGKLQEAEEKPSMVIVSAYGDMANIRTAMNRGAFDFLTKPIDFADLEATIAKTIRHAEMLREIRQKQLAAERAQAALSRYFSPNLAARLAVDDVRLDLGGQRREVASIFTDIESFTHLVETMQPDSLGRLLNEYLAGMTDVVFRHEGTVAKIIGDALHILFGAPMDQPDHAARAVACALDLDDFAQGFRARSAAEGIELGATRIGLHAGPAIVGNFGGSRFFDYTAYGDTINIASRLEAANKQFGTRICVSAALAERADGFVGRPVGELILRGRADSLPCLEPLRSSGNIIARTDGYMKAYQLLQGGDPRAIAAFATHLGEQPDDPLASFHLKRLLNGISGVRITL
jgi:adenylate cyclase